MAHESSRFQLKLRHTNPIANGALQYFHIRDGIELEMLLEEIEISRNGLKGIYLA
jgi:hypothetical protein